MTDIQELALAITALTIATACWWDCRRIRINTERKLKELKRRLKGHTQ